MEETKLKRKFPIPFKFGIRKELFTNFIMIVVILGIMFALMPAIGVNNALVASMCLITVLMSIRNDYTIHPIKNTILFLVVQVGLGALACVAQMHGAAMVLITLGVVFAIIYMFTSNKKQSMYMPLLLTYILMLYYPKEQIWGMELIIRLCILAGSAFLIMLVQILLNKNKFRKKMVKGISGAVGLMGQQLDAISSGENRDELQKRSQLIDKTLAGLSGGMDSRLAQVNEWKKGSYYLKIVFTLKRLNHILTNSYIEDQETMDGAVYQNMKGLLQNITQYEKGEADFASFRDQLQQLELHIGNEYVEYELKEEVDLILKVEEEQAEEEKTKITFQERIKASVNIYKIIFASKTAVLVALGVLVNVLFFEDLPSNYMLPLAIIIMTQPYVELNRKAGWNRLLHTFYAVAMFFIAFSITDILWVHLLILAGILIIGDMFLQFNFSVIYGSLLSLVMGAISARETVANLSFYRFVFIAAACIALMLVDQFVFPHRLGSSMKKHIQTSVALNDKLIRELTNPDSTYGSIRHAVMEIRTANQKIKTTNQYVKSEEVNEYLMHEQEWTIRMLLLLHDLHTEKISKKEMEQSLFLLKDEYSEKENFRTLSNENQKILLLRMAEILREMKQAPECVSGFLSPVGTIST